MDWLMIIKNVVYAFIEPFFNCQTCSHRAAPDAGLSRPFRLEKSLMEI